MRRPVPAWCDLTILALVAACGGNGGDAAPPPRLAEPLASSAVAAAALTVADVVRALAADLPVVGADGGVLVAGVPSAALAGRAPSCAAGGRIMATCSQGRRGSTLRSVAHGCELVDAATGLRVTVDGRLTVTTPSSVCDFGQVPINASRTLTFERFIAVVRAGDEVVLTFRGEHLTQRIQPLLSGCERSDATIDLDGTGSLQGPDGVDAALRASGLRLERRARGAAGRCVHSLRASGGLRVDDQVTGRRVDATLDDLIVDVDADGARLIAGGLALACAERVAIATELPLAGPTGCPASGALRLARGDGSQALVTFDAGAIGVDADADGAVDRAEADCRDSAQCSDAIGAPSP